MSTHQVGASELGTGFVQTDDYDQHSSYRNRSVFRHHPYVVTPDGDRVDLAPDRNYPSAVLTVLDYLGIQRETGDDAA